MDAVADIEAGRCPLCGHPLTDPAKSPEGWAWCRNPCCRRPWRVLRDIGGNKYAMTPHPETLAQTLRHHARRRSGGSTRSGPP